MIFGTVGTHPDGFPRLVEMLDELTASVSETVVVQIGHTPSPPTGCEWFRFKEDFDEIVRLNREARVVVSHGGTSILTAGKEGTPVIAVPRLSSLGEHIDDHQEKFVAALEQAGQVAVAHTVDEILELLQSNLPAWTREQQRKLVEKLRNHLRNHVGESP